MLKCLTLRTDTIKLLVLDEADEMLSRGFTEQIFDVYSYLPPGLQVVLLSATMTQDVSEITAKLMSEPVRILVKRLVFYYYHKYAQLYDVHLLRIAQNVSRSRFGSNFTSSMYHIRALIEYNGSI